MAAMLVITPETVRAAENAYARNPAAAARLKTAADAAMTAGPFSVMDKTLVPPSGDKHDYMSLGPYWWPDPDRADGIPYLRRDGQINPETERFDRPRLNQMVSAVMVLAIAWHLTRIPAYPVRAALLLRTWFLDPATRMNPHLRFGQSIPGRCEGRCIGIIDTECLAHLVDAATLLGDAPAWPMAEQDGLRTWLASYLDWLLTSDLGREEAAERNNHGTCYDVQVVALALFLGRTDLARQILSRVPERRILPQIGADGRLPLELARTRAWFYSILNTDALLNLAGWGRTLGVDLWGFAGSDGRSIPKALDWLTPFALAGQPWTHQELGGWNGGRLHPALVRAAQFDPDRRQDLEAAGIDVDLVCLQIAAGFSGHG